jgi:di/tricarboxylate transporter
MVDALIGLVILVIVVGIVLYVANLLLNLIPMDERFRQIAWVLILLLAALIVLSKALPLVGVSNPL